MDNEKVIETQLEFYKKGKAGRLFAAHAAQNPSQFGWNLSVSDVDSKAIARLVSRSITLPDVSTQSIIFPSVLSSDDLIE